MPNAFPPASPTIAGDYLTVSRFLNTPTLVARRMRTLAEQRLITTSILTGRETVSGGAISFDQNEGLYTDRAVEAVSAGGEYPITTVGDGTAQLAKVVKWGQDTFVTDEAAKRKAMSAVDKALLKLINTAAKNVDTVALAAIASQVTQTQAAAAAWSAASGVQILRDILTAKATLAALNQGYEADTLIINDASWALLASDQVLINAIARETQSNAVYTGNFELIAGLRIMRTPNLPASGAWVLDSAQLGGIATEDLGGNYDKVDGILESKSMRDDDNDQWRLRARAVCVPYITEPNAAIRITGI
jgi:hypothetical protein